MTFRTLPDLPAGQPCAVVATADIDFNDMEYTASPAFSLPIQSADTKCACVAELEAQLATLRHALEPFAAAGRLYRQGGHSLHKAVLSVEGEEAEAILSVKDFTNAADVLR